MKIAIIGTVGVPAKYGGFETLVENIIGKNSSPEIEYIVFCSRKSYKERKKEYKGAFLKYIPFKANGVQSVIYDICSLVQASFCSDEILILGVSGCCFLPLFRLFYKKKIIINIDGLEHRREKWGPVAKRFLKKSEVIAVKYADIIVADNKGIQDYVKNEYKINSKLIAYGGDHVIYNIPKEKECEVLNLLQVNYSYSFSVCRIEPENNVLMILKAFEKAKKKLLFVGNWNKGKYGRLLYEKYKSSNYIKLLNPIYDLDVLNILRSNCEYYIHGHSAGGTNPSLVEAMFFKKTIFAFDVIYNKETTENKAIYFANDEMLAKLLSMPKKEYELVGETLYEIANRKYRWEYIVKLYESLY